MANRNSQKIVWLTSIPVALAFFALVIPSMTVNVNSDEYLSQASEMGSEERPSSVGAELDETITDSSTPGDQIEETVLPDFLAKEHDVDLDANDAVTIKEWSVEDSTGFSEDEAAQLITRDIEGLQGGDSSNDKKQTPRADSSSTGSNKELGDDSIFSPPEVPAEADNSGIKGAPRENCYNNEFSSACRAGFVAPKIEFARYLSCTKRADRNVEIRGLARLVGGSYKDWAWQTAELDGMGIVSSIVSQAPYTLMWGASATFYSMDSRYVGVIEVVGGSGYELIDESLIDPSCRF